MGIGVLGQGEIVDDCVDVRPYASGGQGPNKSGIKNRKDGISVA
jgi:hypothetical protein